MFRDNKMERNTRTTLFAQILFDKKKRETAWKIWAWLLHKICTQPGLLFGPSAHLFAGWILARLGQPTGPLEGRFAWAHAEVRFRTKFTIFFSPFPFEESCCHTCSFSRLTHLCLWLYFFFFFHPTRSSPFDIHKTTRKSLKFQTKSRDMVPRNHSN